MNQRLITGLTLAICITIAICYMPRFAFIATLLVIVLIACWEWTQFLSWPRIPAMGALTVLVTVVMYFLTLANIGGNITENPVWFILLVSIPWWLISLILVVTHPKYQSIWIHNNIVKLLFGLLTLLPFMFSVLQIRYMPQLASSRIAESTVNYNGMHAVFVLLLGCMMVWIADSGAYYGGRRFGKHKLSPNVSPNKTIEGVLSGMLATFIISTIAAKLMGLDEFSLGQLAIISLIVVPVSVVGDLSESMLKRVANIKDSGHFLPGHGGVLDRIDGLSAALPIYTILYFTVVFPG